MIKKIRHSLMSKYLFFIIIALLLWPLIPAVYYLPHILLHQDTLYDIDEIENTWNLEAKKLDGSNKTLVNEQLRRIQTRFPKANLFWVDKTGKTHFLDARLLDVPDQWSSLDVVTFLERNKQQDIYTVTAMIGKKPGQRFLVFQVPISFTSLSMSLPYSDQLLGMIIVVASGSLMIISWFFFLNLRKRIVRLQTAMSDIGKSGIPDKVVIRNQDEIGQLEKAFNNMITQLNASRKREKVEEQLRKQLIANISHDLRTPLTVIRQLAYSVQKDPTSPQGTSSMQVIVNKMDDVSKMIDNLLSYTLLTAGKCPLELKRINVMEEFRNTIAQWYPIFEEEGFVVDVHLPEKELVWLIDPLWFKSILDNLFQNIIRHAKSGRYVGLETVERDGSTFLVIKDRGLGMEHESKAKGTGIGLSIVSLMTKEMNMKWDVSTSSKGTSIYLGGNLN